MHNNELKGKKIFLTGATRGIGNVMAQSLAKKEAHLILPYRGDIQRGEELKHQLTELGATVTVFPMELTQIATYKEVLTPILKELGHLDALINNAGMSKDQLLMRVKEEDIDSIIDLNLKSAIALPAQLLRYLLKSSNPSIINISSIVGLMGNTAQGVYAASKAGLIGLTKSIAKEYASKGVRCNAICPGFIETDMTQALDEGRREQYLEHIPLKRFGNGQDVANLVEFLLSTKSSYITGEILKIDGGLYI